MCHGVLIGSDLLKLCADCGRRTATPSKPVQTYMVPAVRRAGFYWRCRDRLSPPPGESRDFAPAGVTSSVGAFSSDGA